MSAIPFFLRKFVIFSVLCVFVLASFGAPASHAQDAPLDQLLGIEQPQSSSADGPVQTLGDPGDLSEVPDEYIDEAIAFNEECQGSLNLSSNYDCDCLASRYLDERIKGEDKVNRSSILLKIEKECKSAVNAAGANYQKCLSTAVLMPVSMDVEKYCSCFASTYAKIYEQSVQTPSPRLHLEIHKRASTYCRDPSLGGRLYPNMKPLWDNN